MLVLLHRGLAVWESLAIAEYLDLARLPQALRRHRRQGRWLPVRHLRCRRSMYAPVVTRFRNYVVPLDADPEAYAAVVLAHPAMKE